MTAAFFVNLPLRYVGQDPAWLDAFIARGLPPELGLDATAIDRFDDAWHAGVAARLRAAGLPCAVHLPFEDLRPASPDPVMAEASRSRLLAAARIARIYAPRHLVGHPSFQPPNDPAQASAQLAEALRTWNAVLAAAPGCPLLALENTHDRDPARLADLAARLRAIHGGRVGVCFDVGHWHSFARGHALADARRWIDALGPFIRHCHLHDNSGAGDEHLGLGAGSIPWDEILDLLGGLAQRPTATLEPHSEDSLLRSLDFIAGQAQRLAAVFSRAGSGEEDVSGPRA